MIAPPIERPDESAGYLGYYTRRHLDLSFDLVDVDGTSPVVWVYRKAETTTLRFIEEKPGNQQIHDSQDRVLRALATIGLSVYVIYAADQLITPTFPLPVMRLSGYREFDARKSFERSQFDRWLLDGLERRDPRIGAPLHLDSLADDLADITWCADAGAPASHIAERCTDLIERAQHLTARVMAP